MELFNVTTVAEAKQIILNHFKSYQLATETVAISDALGRTLAEEIIAEVNVPHFRRSTVDGYAVIAADTFGAGESMPVFLEVIGEVVMGKTVDTPVTTGKAIYVPTGGALPDGANAVVMVEYVETMGVNNIAIYQSVAPGENIMNCGDDLKQGASIIKRGKIITPADLGVLAALGRVEVKVWSRPRFTIISTGDELIDLNQPLTKGAIRDINSHTLAGMIQQAGGQVVRRLIVPDNIDLLQNALQQALQDNDIILLSGGSSVGNKDLTARLINLVAARYSPGESGVLVHGLAVKPGKPTIIGKIAGKPVFGLPGQPAAAMVIFKILVEFLLTVLTKRENNNEKITNATMAINVHSAPGKECYQMVRLEDNRTEIIAYPVFGKSGMISLIAEAEGYIKIEANQEGVKKGEQVKVFSF